MNDMDDRQSVTFGRVLVVLERGDNFKLYVDQMKLNVYSGDGTFREITKESRWNE